jgi:hypothetical protein
VVNCLGLNTPEMFEVTDKYAPGAEFGLTARRFRFHNSASLGLSNVAITSDPNYGYLYPKWTRIASQGGGLPYDIEIDHCFGLTPQQDGNYATWLLTNAGPHTRLRVKNNLGGVSGGFDAVFGNPAGNDQFGWTNDSNLNASNEWHHNCLQAGNPAALINPGTNTYVGIGGLGLTNEAAAHDPTIGVAGLLQVKPAVGSPAIGCAEGGTNAGPDFDAMTAALAGVRQTADLPT